MSTSPYDTDSGAVMYPKFVKTFHLKTAYLDEPNAHLWLTKYQSIDSWALLVTDEHKETLLVATVNLEEYGHEPKPGQVFIRDWSENAGILPCLIREGVVSGIKDMVSSGYEMVDVVDLLIDAETIWNSEEGAS